MPSRLDDEDACLVGLCDDDFVWLVCVIPDDDDDDNFVWFDACLAF